MWLLLAALACDEDGVPEDSEKCEWLQAYVDADGDGWGDLDAPIQVCEVGEGQSVLGGDCNDADPDQTPETLWFLDADGDGFGDAARQIASCVPQEGLVEVVGDCDDADAGSFPGAEETCDGVDNDCDGAVDNAATDAASLFLDADGDGYGDSAISACEGSEGTVAQGGDCDDADPAISPGAAERCDAIDNDCDGVVDFDGWIPADFATVQDAVDAEREGGHFCLSDGVYPMGGMESWTAITLEGQGVEVAVLDAEGGQGWQAHEDLSLIGLTLSNIDGQEAILAEGDLSLSDVVIQDVQLSSGTVLRGAGWGSFWLQDVEIHGVEGERIRDASVVYMDGAYLDMERVDIHDVSIDGGMTPVVGFYGHSAQLRDVEVSAVSIFVDYAGPEGPLKLQGSESVDVQGLTLQDIEVDFGNLRVGGEGLLLGLVHAGTSPATLRNVSIQDNALHAEQAAYVSGLVTFSWYYDTQISNLVMSGNRVDMPDADMYGLFSGLERLEHADIVGNDFGSWDDCTGLFYNFYRDVHAANVNVVGNSWDCWIHFSADLDAPPDLSWTHSNVYDNDFSGVKLSTARDWGAYEVSTDSFDPLYTSTTGSSAADWDLSLQGGSPAIDAGLGTDADGSAADIGAYGGAHGQGW